MFVENIRSCVWQSMCDVCYGDIGLNTFYLLLDKTIHNRKYVLASCMRIHFIFAHCAVVYKLMKQSHGFDYIYFGMTLTHVLCQNYMI